MTVYDQVTRKVVLQEDFGIAASVPFGAVQSSVIRTGNTLDIYTPPADPKYFFRWFDDYLTANNAVNGWSAQISGGSLTQAWPFTSGYGGVLGAMGIQTGTGSTGYYSLTTFNNALDLDNGFAYSFEVACIMEALSDATNEFTVHIGFGDVWNSASEHANSVAFRYQRTVDGAYWACLTRASSSETKTVTAVEVSNTSYQTLRIEIDEDGDEARFYINSTLVATHTTNMTGSRMGIGIRCAKTAGTTSRSVVVDYHDFIAQRSTPRY